MTDRLLGPEVSDVDGNTEDRGNTISVFNGPAPTIRVLDSLKAETATVSNCEEVLGSGLQCCNMGEKAPEVGTGNSVSRRSSQ